VGLRAGICMGQTGGMTCFLIMVQSFLGVFFLGTLS
jgi:hypothetical protein